MKKYLLLIFGLITCMNTSAEIHTIIAVGQPSWVFQPDTIEARVQDTVVFQWGGDDAFVVKFENNEIPQFRLDSAHTDTTIIISDTSFLGNHRFFEETHGANFSGMHGFLKITSATSIRKLIKENKLSLYPNPFKDQITIKNTGKDLTRVELVDILGSRVRLVACDEKQVYRSIDVTNLPPGIYFTRFYRNEEVILVKRLVKN